MRALCFALLIFPFVIEPGFALSAVGTFWDIGFVAVGLGIAACGWLASRAQPVAAVPRRAQEVDGSTDGRALSIWILYSATAVVLMMGISNRLCLDVASVPFLWILPLATYLLTLILCFSSEGMYQRKLWIVACLLLLPIGIALKVQVDSISPALAAAFETIQVQVPYYTLLLFSLCMVLHGELYRRRPAPERLTLFYLSTSGGGALGGLFVGLAAPMIFSDYHELELGLVLVLVCIAAELVWAPQRAPEDRASSSEGQGMRSARLAALAAAVLISANAGLSFAPSDSTVWQERSFFGVLRVVEKGEGLGKYRSLTHGSTVHGTQFIHKRGRKIPTAYFGKATPLRALFASLDESEPLRVGIVGLGVGTIAAYGRDGDSFRFYEIDPAVGWVAGDEGYFSFMKDSRARVDLQLGDARIALENEIAQGTRQTLDVLIIDAFSGDSIPAHLMTREVFDVYLDVIREGGIIAVHCSNRYLSLPPIVSRIGSEAGLVSVQIRTGAAKRFQSRRADWVFLSARREPLQGVVNAVRAFNQRNGLPQKRATISWPREEALREVSLWTDDHTDLFGALRPLSWAIEGR